MENNLKEIKDFINQWKVRAIDYYNNALVEYKKEKQELKYFNVWNGDYNKKMRELI